MINQRTVYKIDDYTDFFIGFKETTESIKRQAYEIGITDSDRVDGIIIDFFQVLFPNIVSRGIEVLLLRTGVISEKKLSRKAVGERIGISEYRVKQIEDRALKKMIDMIRINNSLETQKN